MLSRQGQRRLSLAITGASGVLYGVRMLQVLVDAGHQVEWMVSAAGLKCLQLECGLPSHPQEILDVLKISSERVRIHDSKNIASSLASGSAIRDLYAGLVMPASMGTVARIAHGISGNLIERHADVLLKEHKKLVLVPRETPVNELHLENMLRLVRLGCYCIPASPGFYHKPEKISDLVDHVVGKVLDAVGLEHELFKPWKGE